MSIRIRIWLTIAVVGILLLAGAARRILPELGAGGLLYPARRPISTALPNNFEAVTFSSEGVRLHGWRGGAVGTRRGTLIYLHGVADNRASGAGILERFRQRGFDVIAYDSRAHGESGGEVCTYGSFEKRDLGRVLDTLPPGPVVLLGSSLGAAVALQLAATDRRVSAVIAAAGFSDLRTVATERAPFVFTAGMLERAFRIAEERGHFLVDDVSPVAAARSITAPVVLLHGGNDVETPPDHSRRVFAALAGPKRLILIPGAGHNHPLPEPVWQELERWIDDVLARPSAGQ